MKSSSNPGPGGAHVRRDGAPAAARWTPDEIEGAEFTAFDGGVSIPPSAAPNAHVDELRHQLEEAYAAGYAEGSAAATAAERGRLSTACRAAEDALEQLRDGEHRWVGNAEENICALAVAVARRILDREIATTPEIVQALIARAMVDFPLDQTAVIRVNPTDLALVTSAAGMEATGTASRPDTNWVADSRVGRGGCVIEGRDRIIDGRVDTALERLYRTLSATNA
jgi:flagellar assembly protein FliH